ncbi:MAG: JAB domain-containing protein [Prosthecobacter sp.]|nr:JAB domain-containing protein [Prosthecobacter sp.]
MTLKQLELFLPNPSNPPAQRGRKSAPQELKVISLRECPSPESLMLMDCPAKAVEYWHRHITTSQQYNADVECVVVLVLTTRLRIKGHYIVSVGSLNEAMAHPREVFRIAIMATAHAIVLMHNHPSGDSSPSPADTSLTRRVREAGELLRIELCDHIIVGYQRYFSFKESCII